jgi:metal-dependent amidase/aminoacylase/carboxypeptidase family protein
MKLIEDGMRRTAAGVAAAFGAIAKLDFPDTVGPLVNNPAETTFIADADGATAGDAQPGGRG